MLVEGEFVGVEPSARGFGDGEARRHGIGAFLRNGGEPGVVGNRGGASDAGIGVCREPERIGPAGADYSVVVEENHVARRHGADAVVAGAGEADVFVEAFHADAVRVPFGEAQERGTDRGIAASVLDKENQDVRRRVLQQRFRERRQVFGVIVEGDDDGERRLGGRFGAEAPADPFLP